MPSTRYGRPHWLDLAKEPGKPAWPVLRGEASCQVAVIGGGLAGCTAAWAFANSGVSTALLEAELIGRGATAGASGLGDAGVGSSFLALREQHGLRAARQMWDAERLACLEMQAMIRRLRIRCRHAPVSINVVAMTDDEATGLEREHRELTDAGFEATWLAGKRATEATGLGACAVLKRTGAFVADPLALAMGFARAASRNKARIYERSAVRHVEAGTKGVDVRTDAGVLHAETVVVATDLPQPGMKALHRHVRPCMTAGAVVPSLSRPLQRSLGPAGDRVFCGVARPQRGWHLDAAGTLLLWQSDQPFPAVRGAEVAVQRASQLMYEFSLLHPEVSGLQPSLGWATPAHRSGDGLAIAGPHRAFPRHLFAVGLGAEGLQGAWLAAQINLRYYRGRSERSDLLMGFLR
ncbi:MAG: NAD(P)/FAD-dependent oxidoreductase [Vicinamibacterales bacterium]